MLSVERLDIIAETAKKEGAVKTDELIKRFNVSPETVRRDLLALERQGVLKRVYGGAVACGGTVRIKNLGERIDDFRKQKQQLSHFAAGLINEGDIIALDEGSTAKEFASVLAERFSSLTVVTHSLDVLECLRGCAGINVIICGGSFNPSENAFCGELTAEAFSKLRVMKSFIFPSALSLDGGIMDVSDGFTHIQKTMIDIADKIIVMADSSKFEKNALYRLCRLDTSFTYVTDPEIPEIIVKLYEENGIKIIRS